MKTLFFGLGILALAINPLAAQTTPFGVGSSANFSHDGKDVLGGPETLASCEMALTSVTVADLNIAGTPIKSITGPAKAGANTIPLAPLFTGQPNGTYKLWVRVADAAGNLSAWAPGLTLTLDATKPSIPTNISITVTVTVGP